MFKALDLVLLIAAGGVFCFGLFLKLRRLSLGKPECRCDDPCERMKAAIKAVVNHVRIRREPQGVHHHYLLIAFGVPLLAILIAQFAFRLPVFIAGPVSLIIEVAALLGAYGLVRLTIRRYSVKPDQLDEKPEDLPAHLLLLAVFATGFLTAGLRVASAPTTMSWFSPAGALFSLPFLPFSPSMKATMIAALWRTHLYLVLFTIATIPYGRMSHVVFGALNIYFQRRGPKGEFSKLDLENSEVFGVGQVELFTRKQMLDFEACVRCGRCQARCPAYNTGKTLNPKKVIQDLKAHWYAKAPFLHKGEGDSFESPMIDGEGVIQDDLWSCTTCRHCMEVCPMMIEHVHAIVDMRRHMVLMEGTMPQELVILNKNLENNFNPWGVGWSARNDWMARRGVSPRVLTEEESPEFDVLLWVGCAGAYDDRYQRVVASLVRLMDRAGVSYGLLGTDEKCCGDPARSTGNEYLYQSIVGENVEVMNRIGVKKIVTPCPHCLKTLAVEYPQFGGNYDVVHHSAFLLELVKTGKLVPGKGFSKDVTLHDSCYLSRYAGLVDEPRGLLTSAEGVTLKEMPRSREDNFCCGAGGGRMWMEEHGTRINNVRVEEALSTGASTICTACPFCLTMLSDGVKAAKREEEVAVYDLAEILERSMS